MRARPVLTRIMEKFEVSDTGCWIWTGARTEKGYGLVNLDGRSRRAHRVAYEKLVGEIPEGLQIDHLCRTPSCVNPEHLEPVTPRENTLRGDGVAARRARQTHCKRGHELAGDNLYRDPRRPTNRICNVCRRLRQRG